MKNITFITETIKLVRTELITLIKIYINKEQPYCVGFPELPIVIDRFYCEQIKIYGNGNIEAKSQDGLGKKITSNLRNLSTDDLVIIMEAINKIEYLDIL